MPAKPFLASSATLLLAAEGFAVWTLFSTLPLLTGAPAIREAWDTNAYWSLGLPVLMLSVAAAGAFAPDSPWKLAAWAVAGYFLGVLLIAKSGTSFALLPLTLVFVGLPLFGVLAGFGWAGRGLRRARAGGGHGVS
jgi:hypothetical protein